MRVLLIEDDRNAARSVELLLKADGFTLEITGQGEDGVELAQAYGYDAILLDLSLPDMSGMDVLRTLRRAKLSTPIIILSGASDVAAKVAALGGADDYVVSRSLRRAHAAAP